MNTSAAAFHSVKERGSDTTQLVRLIRWFAEQMPGDSFIPRDIHAMVFPHMVSKDGFTSRIKILVRLMLVEISDKRVDPATGQEVNAYRISNAGRMLVKAAPHPNDLRRFFLDMDKARSDLIEERRRKFAVIRDEYDRLIKFNQWKAQKEWVAEIRKVLD